jgi:hypothetical protein
MKTIQAFFIDQMIDLLDGDQWDNPSCFATIDQLLKLPIDEDMWWELQTTVRPNIYNPSAELHKGKEWNSQHLYWFDDDTLADESAATLHEAMCKAWLMWKLS